MRIVQRLSRVLLTGAVVLAAGSAADLVAQSAPAGEQPNLIGIWLLDVSKSRYSPGPGPISETRTYTRAAVGVHGKIERRYADGRHEIIEYRADADHDSPVTGTPAYDAARFKRVDSYTTESVLSHAGRVFGTARRVISPDGESMTITFRRTEPGDMVNNVAQYRKKR